MAKGDTVQNPPNAVAGAAFRPPFQGFGSAPNSLFPSPPPNNGPGGTMSASFNNQGVGPSGPMQGMPPNLQGGQMPMGNAGPSPDVIQNLLQAFLGHLNGQRQLPVGDNTQGAFNPPTQASGGNSPVSNPVIRARQY